MLRSFVLLLALLIAGGSAVHAEGPFLATGIKIGEVTSDSAIVWARLTAIKKPQQPALGVAQPAKAADGEIAGLAGAVPGMAGKLGLEFSAMPDFADAIYPKIATVTAATDFTYQWKLSGLKPGSGYRVRVIAYGKDGTESAVETGHFVTAPKSENWQDVRFAVMSCQSHKDRDELEGFRIYPAMQKAGIAFYVATGDNVYYDSDPPLADSVPLARFHWNRMHGLPGLVEFHRQVPGYWEKDDHDTVRNDSWPPQGKNVDRSETLDGKLTFFKGLKVFREQVPMGEKTYRTFRWGRGLQIWLTEGRDFRSPNNMPDGPEKTIWGREQLDWLKSGLLVSDADFKVLISPTPVVGPDRANKADNHSNATFGQEGNAFRKWVQDNKLTGNLFVCCGDRHWQYHSVDPATGLHEFSAGAASDKHAGGSPGLDPDFHKFHRVKGGFLTVHVAKRDEAPTIAFRHHDVDGQVVYEHVFPR
jgi:alkaline phosphatase D